jgi:uncharacterized protein YigE (DUF2233 family)
MARRISLILALALLALSPAHAQPCAPETFEGNGYIVCTADPLEDDLQLFWKDSSDRPYRHFGPLADTVTADGQNLAFAINAGMYLDDFTPVGLYVEDGEQLRPLDTASVEGPPASVPNFYKKPNGIFFVGDGGAGVLTTEAYARDRPSVNYATQSGPMLVIKGELHPALIPGSSDRTRRSGVGICEAGLVRVAISDGNVNFHDFARLFRDHLQCPDALFLDGGRGTGLYAPALGRRDFSWHGGFGPILGVVDTPR